MLLFAFWSSTCLAAKHALLIGIGDYGETAFASLDGSQNDVALMHDVLTSRFEFPSSNVQILQDAQATHSGIRQAFAALAVRIETGDIVYIHYSGHGSFTRDQNGDERSGYDQTWVSYGARRNSDSTKIDNYDVLDDEIDEWLQDILAKTEHVIFVSDSCHSASITRGEAPKVRAVPADERPHPLGGRRQSSSDATGSVRVGAAGDKQSAAEFQFEEGSYYGLFTWHWAQALARSSPGTTWDEVFQSVTAKVRLSRGDSQQPQMEGNRRQIVFAAEFAAVPITVPVIDVRGEGSRVWIRGGMLSGMTVGSTFRLNGTLNQDDGVDRSSTLQIVRVLATEAEAEVLEGSFQVGDLVEEQQHAYPFEPTPIFVSGDFTLDLDRTIKSELVRSIEALDAYSVVDTQKSSELVLYITRAKRDESGKLVYANTGDTLPETDRERDPEVWVLTPVEQLLHENLRFSLAKLDLGLQRLGNDLRKLARIREVKALGTGGTGKPAITVTAMLLDPTDKCPLNARCHDLPGLGLFRMDGWFPVEELNTRELVQEQIVTFSIGNDASSDYYVYLLDIGPDGAIEVIFPEAGLSDDEALISPGENLDLFERGHALLLDKGGEETVKIIASHEAINVTLLEQSGFTARGDTRGKDMNPLERLLSSALSGTRGVSILIHPTTWGTQQYTLNVASGSP